MSKQPKQPTTAKMWAICGRNGKPWAYTATYTRRDSIATFERNLRQKWADLKARGYRCIKVAVIPSDADANGWRPIKSAPKDGRAVDLWCITPSNLRVRRTGYKVKGGWQVYLNGQDTPTSTLQLTPTHWRPLDGPESTK